MRKNLLALAAAAAMTSVGISANAQLATENFETGIPATWLMINDANTPAIFTNAALNDSLSHNAWIRYKVDGTNFGYSMFSTSYFTSAATADRWLISPAFTVTSANTILKWAQTDLGSGETLQVLVSPTAGTTAASFTATLVSGAINSSDFTTVAASLSAYNGQTIRVAFREHATDNYLMAIDAIGSQIQANASDLALTSIAPAAGSFGAYTAAGGSGTVSGVIQNNGAQAVTSAVVYYQQGANAPVSQTVTFNPALQPLAMSSFSFTTGVSTPTTGSYPVKVYVVGTGDAVHTNDTLNTSFTAIDSMQTRMHLFEEFTGASCDPCANAVGNVDSVCINNASRMNSIRYHIDIPARDLMYNMTNTLVDARATYYALGGVPDGQLNGSYVYPGAAGPGTFSSATISGEAPKSPLAISGTASFNSSTNTFNVTANIKSFATLPAGLVAQVALTVDNITYSGNISLESLPQTTFPDVVENMFPSSAGTTLTAFTPGQTQTVTSSWVKNHNWGDVITGRTYTSTSTGKMTIWVEDHATKAVYQSFSIPLTGLTDAGSTTAINNVFGNDSKMEIYPNPTSSTANITFDLKSASDVTVEIVDAVGHIVNTIPTQKMNAGAQKISVSTANLANGIYNVKVTTEAGSVSKRLTVVKG